jgi:2-methylcitrate dehydratase PrpD
LFKTQELARFITGLSYGDLPEPVVAKAKDLIAHALGVQLAASTLPWSKQAYRVIRDQGGAPQSTVVNYGLRTSMTNAAFLNSSFSHGFEMDDNHARTGVKAGCVTVPAALAVGEHRLSSGEDVITAVVAGFEVQLRLGLAVYAGFADQIAHATGGTGAVGAAAVAGKLLRLSPDELAFALASGASQTSGLSEVPASGRGHLKRIFGGMATAGGIRSALLAEAGLTAPLTTLDAGNGFIQAFKSDDTVGELTDGLGSRWEILNVHYKIYAQDGMIQPMTEALKQIRAEHDFEFGDIESVWVGTNRRSHDEIVGTIREPLDLTDAQFSANFSVALYLATGGASFADYTERNLHDPRIRDLSRRVTLEVDGEVDRHYDKVRSRGAKVRVRLKSGEEHGAYVEDLRMLGPGELEAKFRDLSGRVLGERRSRALYDRIGTLENVPDVSMITPMLACGEEHP